MTHHHTKQFAIVLGLGLTGASCVRYCLKQGWQVLVMDSRENPSQLDAFQQSFPTVEIRCGEFDLTRLLKADLIIASPGVDINLPVLKSVMAQGIELVGDVELFAQNCSAKIIAITGSNGKSTVCDCLGWIAAELGIDAVVAGNIGTPVLDLLEQPTPEFYILELSSFQIESLKSLKAEAVSVLNISADHLDRHQTLDNYAAIKRRLYTMTKSAAVNLDDKLTIDEFLPEQQCSFGSNDRATIWVKTDDNGFTVFYKNTELLQEQDCLLKGSHNGLNFAACLSLLTLVGIEITSDVIKAIQTYSGLTHRCQRVETTDGIEWINDSKATNVGATVAAIGGFYKPDSQLYLIAGGDAKGADISELGKTIQQCIQHTWVFGKDAALFERCLPKNLCSVVDDLNAAVSDCKTVVRKGDTVLFSPACASLDMYDNYQLRGDHFMQLVREAK
jgi:UDP-N-acetylmuramoylalanine--D-glutamate ligase